MGWSAVAKYILSRVDTEAGESITNLKMQKLLYYCQAWSLALRNGALFNNEFKAWQHGPVIPEAYHHYKKYVYNSIDIAEELKGFDEELLSPDDRALIDEVFSLYGPVPAKRLELMTHEEEPWIKARELAKQGVDSPTMSKEVIQEFFRSKLTDEDGQKS